jgi:hypothetical protein
VGRQVAISPLVLKAINEAGGFDTILTFLVIKFIVSLDVILF